MGRGQNFRGDTHQINLETIQMHLNFYKRVENVEGKGEVVVLQMNNIDQTALAASAQTSREVCVNPP